MRVLVFEFVTGGGWHSVSADAPPPSLLAEGAAMLRTVAADLSAIPGVQVDVLHDPRYTPEPKLPVAIHSIGSAQQETDTLNVVAATADWTMIIAPETDEQLLNRARLVAAAGGRLLGSALSTITLTADKQATAEHLAARSVPAPCGIALAPGQRVPADFSFPAVLKPRDGCGSQDVRLLEDPCEQVIADKSARLEVYIPGVAASVACLCGTREIIPLVPCEQLLSPDGEFRYLGGALPLEPALAARAASLASRAVGTLEGPLGYLGVDLVLGDDPAGKNDVVIEINPRLTTSYVGLRKLSQVNLAQAMLSVAAGHAARIAWSDRSLRFTPDGQVCTVATAGVA